MPPNLSICFPSLAIWATCDQLHRNLRICYSCHAHYSGHFAPQKTRFEPQIEWQNSRWPQISLLLLVFNLVWYRSNSMVNLTWRNLMLFDQVCHLLRSLGHVQSKSGWPTDLSNVHHASKIILPQFLVIQFHPSVGGISISTAGKVLIACLEIDIC